jgi:hypothetical protein
LYRQHRRDALGLEELPIRICGPVQRERKEAYHGIRGSHKQEPLNLACIFWHPGRP